MKRILVVGAGFAGVWSTVSAARLLDQHGIGPEDIEIMVVAPRASLDLRPRLYELNAASMTRPVGALFDAIDVRFVAGSVGSIDTNAREVRVTDRNGSPASYSYDRLIVASGSRLIRPDIPGFSDYSFSIDQLDEAAAFEAHLHMLSARPDSLARNTAVVIGGGFTGIEIATELPARLRAILGDSASVRVVVVERSDVIGPELGAGPRPIIVEALASQGVECLLGVSVTEIDANGVLTTSGERIESSTVLWTGGMQASALAQSLPGELDALGRLRVDYDLRLPRAPDIFAAGDTACAATDEAGHHSLMSCQHALILGRFAGHNAAADLIGVEPLRYSQEHYGTCLDLGPWGSVVTSGWDRDVQVTGAAAKEYKRFVNSVVIEPPAPIRETALAAGEPLAHFETTT